MSSATSKMSSLKEPSRTTLRVVQGPSPLPLWLGGGASTCHIAASSFTCQRQWRRAIPKGTAPTPTFVPNTILSIFGSAHLGTGATSLPIQWDISIIWSFEWAVLPAHSGCQSCHIEGCNDPQHVFTIIHTLSLIKSTCLAPIQVLFRKCWTIQTPIYELWGTSVNCTSKSLLFDPCLQKQSHNNGYPNQWVPNNRCQRDKQAHVLCSIQPPQVWPLSCKDLSHTFPCELLQQCMSKGHLSPYYAWTAKVRFLTLWTPSHLDFH